MQKSERDKLVEIDVAVGRLDEKITAFISKAEILLDKHDTMLFGDRGRNGLQSRVGYMEKLMAARRKIFFFLHAPVWALIGKFIYDAFTR